MKSCYIRNIKSYLDMKIRNKYVTINEITLKDFLYIEDLSFSVIRVFTEI